MITDPERQAFKEVLGHRYTKKVQAVLKEQGVKDQFGKTHSTKMITQVFNAEVTHVLIEDAILTAVKNQVAENKKEARKKERLIKSLQ